MTVSRSPNPISTDNDAWPTARQHLEQGARGERTEMEVWVLDTSAIVAFPEIFDVADTGELVVPLLVIEELDGLKRRQDDVGWAARSALRRLEELRAGGSLSEAVPLPYGAMVRVEPNGLHLSELVEFGLDADKPDNRILAAALGQMPCTLVSNDAALRLKAAQLGVRAVELGASGSKPRSGWYEIDGEPAMIDAAYQNHRLDEGDLGPVAGLEVNEFAVVRHGSQSVLLRRRPEGASVLRSVEAWGVRSRNKEQRFALELLMDPECPVVALEGAAGSGKTLLAMAAGLEQVVEQRRYQRLRVFRPVVPVDRTDLGFLPGDLDEKLHPWMAAIVDVFEALAPADHADRERTAHQVIEELRARGQLSLEAVTFLRGRTLARSFVLVDEAQNLSPAALKTILTRAGEETKVVFTGDCTQIDQPYLSTETNALAVLRSRFVGVREFGRLSMAAVERGPVAELAARLL